MQTKRSFRPIRALIGLAMMLGGAGVIYWELFIHTGRIRIVGLAAMLLIGGVGGLLVLIRSVAKVCARCATEIDGIELAFSPELLPITKAYATQPIDLTPLASSRITQAEDQRAILRVEGCPTCRTFTHVSSHLAVWKGSHFDATQQSPERPTHPSEDGALSQLMSNRTQ